MADSEIYAVDFDGTLCESRYPDIGPPIQEVIDYVRSLASSGARLILWTCRTEDRLQEAVDWCTGQGIDFDAINENLEDRIQQYGGDTRKVSASFYIDDKAITVESITNGQVVQKVKETKFKQMWNLKQAAASDDLDLYIYGDVSDLEIDWVNMAYVESENSAKHFREELAKHPDSKQINIYINSYGGSVFEGTAIYNQLRRHPAQKIVHIDGFACSVASVIAMVGDKIVMPRNAMMMIHNMWMGVVGNAKDLRKAADDLDVISKGNRQAYIQKAGDKLTEDQLMQMLEAETWLTAEDCITYGLADEYAEQDADMSKAVEALQKMNLNLTQRIQINKSLVAQLREITQTADPAPVPLPVPPPNPDPDPVKPGQNKSPNLFAAFSAGKGKEHA